MAGLGTRALTISVATIDYTAQVSSARVTTGEADSDFVTFADAAAGGGRQYNLAFTAVQDLAVGTLWDKVWTVSGSTVACLLKPYGNTAASAGQPHYSFNAIVKEPDGDLLGGEANASTTSKFTFEAEWPLESKPVKVIV